MNKVPPGTLTNFLVAANIAVAAITLWPSAFDNALLAGGMFPARFTAGDFVYANSGFLLPVWLTPFSSAFLHGSVMHLVLNMLMLLIMGRKTERVLGWQGLAVLYAAGMIASTSAEIIASPYSLVPVVGASGAISAVVAAYLLLFPNIAPKPWGNTPAHYARPLQLMLMWTAINLLLRYAGTGTDIAIWAHIGGFAIGLLIAKPLLLWKYRKA
jgi:membrane associated rhomboid family serine protease